MAWEDDNWPTSGSQFSLPQRDAELGKSQERGMASVGIGGFGGIRTAEWQDGDGGISRLRTRGGWPVFEKDPVEIESIPPRGFVAKIPNVRAVLFNPYTLDVLVTPYLPAVNTYTVLDFATTWNVPASDTTDWSDVILFDGQAVKVNNLAMPSIGVTADHGYSAIPYFINRNDASNQYGTAEANATEKRVFAVGRDRATTWGGAGALKTLSPEDPRTNSPRTSFSIGQRLFFSDDSAQLGQFYYPIVASGWDDDSTEWLFSSAHIAMTTSFPYLASTPGSAAIVMPEPAFASSSSSGTMTTAELLPPTPIAVTGAGEIFKTGDAIRGIRWGWNGKVSKPLMGDVYASFVRSEYSGSVSQQETFAGQLVSYTGDNSKIWDTRNETLRLQVQYVPVAGHAATTGWQSLSASVDTLFWENETAVAGTRGVNGVGIAGGNIGTSSPAVRSHMDQLGSFVVSIDAATLVSVSFSRASSSGEKWIATPNTTTFDNLLADPYGLVGANSGMGIYSKIYLLGAYIPSIDKTPIYDYYKQNPTPPPAQLPGAQDDITAMFDSKAAEIVPQVLYDCLNSDGYYDGSFTYIGSIDPDVSLSSESLSWVTVDHILFDETNGVYVSIEGEYSGADGDATLTVSLRIITRYSNTVQVLEQYAYGSTGLPPEVEIAPGVFVVPSPKIRAIFAPLYQEQGSFKGAHYVELSEEMNGAAPAHLFNFVLRLMTYDSIGTVNGLNESEQEVYFIPCNLLEMLYSVVFSNAFGVSGVRYPVDFPVRFSDVMDSLFTNLYRVAVRDGIAVNWTDALGADFAAVAPISLHRT